MVVIIFPVHDLPSVAWAMRVEHLPVKTETFLERSLSLLTGFSHQMFTSWCLSKYFQKNRDAIFVRSIF